jgi:hypothetical protein
MRSTPRSARVAMSICLGHASFLGRPDVHRHPDQPLRWLNSVATDTISTSHRTTEHDSSRALNEYYKFLSLLYSNGILSIAISFFNLCHHSICLNCLPGVISNLIYQLIQSTVSLCLHAYQKP